MEMLNLRRPDLDKAETLKQSWFNGSFTSNGLDTICIGWLPLLELTERSQRIRYGLLLFCLMILILIYCRAFWKLIGEIRF